MRYIDYVLFLAITATILQADAAPVTIQNSWPIGGTERRFQGQCSLSFTQAYAVGALEMTLAFDTNTHNLDDFNNWSDDASSSCRANQQSTNCVSYARFNTWVISAGSTLNYGFQLSYYGTQNSPPVGTCTVGTGSAATTTTTTTTTTTAATTTIASQATTTAGSSTSGTYNYTEVTYKSILFYRAQRSGDLPTVTDDPVPWRKDSTLNDGSDVVEDLTGGWFDAGDYVKFNFPMASATAMLSWGVIQWKSTYVSMGLHADMLDCIKWAFDYFLKCWKPSQNVNYSQVGSGTPDHNYMGRPEDMTIARPSFNVTSAVGGSDVAGSTVAAFAAGAMAFRGENNAYSDELLSAAESLFVFADDYRNKYTVQVTDANSFYPSYSYNDDLVFAAAMLYKATNNATYLTKAEALYNEFGFDNQIPEALDWDDKLIAAKMLLYEATSNTKYSDDISSFLTKWRPGGTIPYTSGGTLAYLRKWGSLRYAANAAFMALMAADHGLYPAVNRAWAKSQIHYMLGTNPRSSSYVVGFGNNPPKRPHHRSSFCSPSPASCTWTQWNADTDNYHTLYGALVGGPKIDDTYADQRAGGENYVYSEVAVDYNAGFQSAVVGLASVTTT